MWFWKQGKGIRVCKQLNLSHVTHRTLLNYCENSHLDPSPFTRCPCLGSLPPSPFPETRNATVCLSYVCQFTSIKREISFLQHNCTAGDAQNFSRLYEYLCEWLLAMAWAFLFFKPGCNLYYAELLREWRHAQLLTCRCVRPGCNLYYAVLFTGKSCIIQKARQMG